MDANILAVLVFGFWLSNFLVPIISFRMAWR